MARSTRGKLILVNVLRRILLFVGRRRAAVIEGLADPGLDLVAKPAVGVLQDVVAGAAEAKIAVMRVVELVPTALDGDRWAGGTRGSGRAGRDAVRPCQFEDAALCVLKVTTSEACRT